MGRDAQHHRPHPLLVHERIPNQLVKPGQQGRIPPPCVRAFRGQEGYLDKRPQCNDEHGIGPVLLALHGIMSLADALTEDPEA